MWLQWVGESNQAFCMTAFPCVSTSVPINIRVSIRVRGLHLACSLWCNTAAREIVVDVGKGPAGFRPCVAQRIAQLREECRQCTHAVLREELAHRRG